jgi:hypothetical protein
LLPVCLHGGIIPLFGCLARERWTLLRNAHAVAKGQSKEAL